MIDDDIFVRLLNLPDCMKGAVRENHDGTYTIILNSKLTYEQRLETIQHEREHIRYNDFRSTKSADEIEQKRHR